MRDRTEYQREYHVRWREENRERYRELQRASDKRRRKARTQMMDKWRGENREHYLKLHRAHSVVYSALKSGRLQKQPCEVCGSEESEAHHDDYDRPLDVRWFCKPHHYKADLSS